MDDLDESPLARMMKMAKAENEAAPFGHSRVMNAFMNRQKDGRAGGRPKLETKYPRRTRKETE